MSTITREMLNIPSDMLRDDASTIAKLTQLRSQLKQQKDRRVVANNIKQSLKEKEAAGNGGENFNGFFEIGFPPKIYPWEKGFEEYMVFCHERAARRNKALLDAHPDYKLKKPYTITIDLDTKATDGFVEQLYEHINVWTEPCLIRLSDILKQTDPYHDAFEEFKLYENSTHPDRISCRRHYALPHSHREDPSCECIFCRACRETISMLTTSGLTPEHLALCMIDKIRQRTSSVLISQIKMSFQEEADIGLDERICYGFRSALPPLVILHFEHVFHEMYTIGADLAWEIVKKLAVIIKYTPDYTSALHFLTFWVDSYERLERVVCRLEDDMDCFNWKLKKYNLNLRLLFLHFIDSLIHQLDEFQDALRHCKRVVALQRMYHPLRENEIDNRHLLFALDEVERNLSEIHERWKDHCLPFEVRKYVVPKFNVFKISRLRNPYIRLQPNICEAYEVIECLVTGTLELRKVEKEVISECDFADPILDVCIAHPKQQKERFHIRLYRRDLCLCPSEIDHFVKKGDVNFIRNHGANVTLEYGGRDYMEDYLQKRELTNLDEVEGRLPMEVEDVLYADNRQSARDEVQHKKRIEISQARERSMRSAKVKWPPTYPIYGHRTRQRGMIRSFRTILQRTLWKPKVLKYCRRGIKCERYERIFTSRHRYAYGGLPLINRDSRSALMESQKYDFIQEILSTALQLGTGMIDPLGEAVNKSYKYYVMYSHMDISAQRPPERHPRPTLSTEHSPELFATLCQVINIHYNCLAKYDLITVDESLSSPHQLQKQWAALNEKETNDARNKAKIETLTKAGATSIRVQASAMTGLDECSAPNFKCFNNPNNPGSRRKVTVAPAATPLGDNEEDREHVVAISEDGQIVAFGTRISPPPPEPRIRNCRSREKPQNNWKGSSCRCPHGHGETMSHSVTFDGTLHLETTLDVGGGVCSHHSPETVNKHTYPPPSARSQPSNVSSRSGSTKSETRPTRPGIPINPRFAEKRNDLRQKLEIERKAREACLHALRTEVPASSPFSSQAAKKATKKETVIITTASPVTDDLDELVNIIEGTPCSGSRKGSLVDADPKRAAKKARKKERKEQQRLEEEAKRIAEEELQRQLEEERIRKEEEEQEEIDKKKREKRKQKKKRRKNRTMDDELSESYNDLLTCVRDGEAPEWDEEEVPEYIPDPTEAKKIKQQEKKKKKKEEKMKEGLKSVASPQLTANSKLFTDIKTTGSLRTEDNPIVTIRRHSNTPDANVTISVKGDNGEEDLLYTLVNGKVLRAEVISKITPSMVVNTETNKKKKKKSRGPDPSAQRTISTASDPPEVTLSRINENSIMMLDNSKFGQDIGSSNHSGNVMNSYVRQNQHLAPGDNSQSQDLDVNNLNLPSGLIITRLDQPMSLYSGTHNNAEQRGWESMNTNRAPNNTHVYSNVPQGFYHNEQNVYLRNSKYGQYDDHGFGQHIVFPGKESGPGEFEEVVSNKKRRLRNKANKLKDGEDDLEVFSHHGDSNGSLEFKMMEMSLNTSSSSHRRTPDESVPAQLNTSGDAGRRKRISQKLQMKAVQETIHRNANGQSVKGGCNKSAYQTRESATNAEYISGSDCVNINSRGGKFHRGGVTSIPRLNKQIPIRPLFNITATPMEEIHKPPMNSWSQAQTANTNTCEQPIMFDATLRRLSDIGYVQSQSQPGHFEKNELSLINGGWHPLNSYNADCPPVSFHPIDASHMYQNNMAPRPPFHPSESHINFQPQQPPQSLEYMNSGINTFQPNQPFNFESSYADYQNHPNFNGSSFNNMAESVAFQRSNITSDYNPQSQTTTFTAPWRKTVNATGIADTFASVLKRIESDAREPVFGPFAQAERTSGSPWIWGESDRSESGSGGARPSPEVFYQTNPVGSAVSSGHRNHYMDENLGVNNTNSRAQSCDSALVGPGIGVAIGSPYPTIHQNPIRRPIPTSPYTLANPPDEQNQIPHSEMNISGSPGPGVPEWDSSIKLGTFWSSHKTPR